MKTIQTLIREAAEETDITYRSYSGRGMYGRNCIGIVGDMSQMQVLIGIVIKNAVQELFEAAIDCADGEENAAYHKNDQVQNLIDSIMEYSWDSMGLSTVVYWPDIEFEDEPEISFEQWKAAVANKLGITENQLEKLGDAIQDLQEAFDDGWDVEEAVEHYRVGR